MVLGLCAAAALGASCGDDDVSSDSKNDVPLFDGDGSFPDGTTDATGTTNDATTTRDTSDVRDTTPGDLIPDIDPPVVLSTTPAGGADNVALPLTVTIVLNEPVYAPRVSAANIKLLDWLDNEIPGTPTLSADGKTITWKPTQNNQQLASSYTILLKGGANFGLTDLAGNSIPNDQRFTFTTANYPSQDAYQALAAKYAPTIHSGVSADLNAQMQVPTKVDGDGDWNVENNRAWITNGATQLIPAVYYSVTETRTHYFIAYVLYWPYIKLEPPEPTNVSHTNGSSGVLIVVEKARGEIAERPIGAWTYWKELNREENFAFATTESDLVPGEDSAGSGSLKAELAQATLFPDNRLQLYVSPGYHRSCIKDWAEGGVTPACPWTSEQQNGDTLVFAYLGGSPTPVVKKEGVWPSDMSDVDGDPESFGYALIPMWSSLWPRRFATGEGAVYTPTTFTYTADSGRPGANLELTARYLETLGSDLTAYGRPFWAWEWDPASSGPNDLIDAVTQGQMALDPAFYVWERHHRAGKANGLTDYVEATGVGYSLDYCFNGYAVLDVRTTDPKCAAPQ